MHRLLQRPGQRHGEKKTKDRENKERYSRTETKGREIQYKVVKD
jgi:hypothetical protein